MSTLCMAASRRLQNTVTYVEPTPPSLCGRTWVYTVAIANVAGYSTPVTYTASPNGTPFRTLDWCVH